MKLKIQLLYQSELAAQERSSINIFDQALTPESPINALTPPGTVKGTGDDFMTNDRVTELVDEENEKESVRAPPIELTDACRDSWFEP